ncbi:Photosystem I chlorophyll a/b-binding protein 5, chloroplastic [Coccomyxa sp. Obi]|nr:Photosystem I chlorophyll a/b-binding protein 5, chloroplastic [Coccomyxa sp. Obi]
MNTSMLTSSFVSRAAARPSQARPFVSNGSRVCMKVGNWLPGSKTPAYLEDLPGSYGFDPLKLGEDPAALKWYVQSELVHSRFAMAAVAGILIPEVLKKFGAVNLPVWYEAGKYAQESSPIPFNTLIALEIFAFNFVEIKRWQDFKKPGSQAEPGSFVGLEGFFKGTGENGYPGGIFDPLGLSKGPGFEAMKLREIKNGRLAMLAFIGFAFQYLATGKGPLDNLTDHLSNPLANNFTTNGTSLPAQAHPLLSVLKP